MKSFKAIFLRDSWCYPAQALLLRLKHILHMATAATAATGFGKWRVAGTSLRVPAKARPLWAQGSKWHFYQVCKFFSGRGGKSSAQLSGSSPGRSTTFLTFLQGRKFSAPTERTFAAPNFGRISSACVSTRWLCRDRACPVSTAAVHVTWLTFATRISLLLLVACAEQEPAVAPAPVTDFGSGVWIGNEGNFGWGYGSLSFYDPQQKQVQNEVYRQKHGQVLGNVVQQVTEINGELWVVVNNSQKIERLDLQTLERQEPINGLTSPRQAVQLPDGRVLVSDLYAGHLWQLEPQAEGYDVQPLPQQLGWTEQLLLQGNQLYVVQHQPERLLVPQLNALQNELWSASPFRGGKLACGHRCECSGQYVPAAATAR